MNPIHEKPESNISQLQFLYTNIVQHMIGRLHHKWLFYYHVNMYAFNIYGMSLAFYCLPALIDNHNFLQF